MSEVWLAIALGTVMTVLVKGSGPAIFAGRPLSVNARRLVAALPAAVLAAIVVTQTFGADRTLQLDARAAGVAVAGLALLRRANLLLVLIAAAATTALVRLLS